MVKPSTSKQRHKKRKRKVPVNLLPLKESQLKKNDVLEKLEKVEEFPGGQELYPVNFVEPRIALADFHLHSDGKYSPQHVIARAAHNGVKYMSLTDHDTTAGVEEAMECAKKLDVFVIPGVEISAEDQNENIHILAYFAPGSDFVEISKMLEKIRNRRYSRGKEMVSKLESFGMKLDWENVLKIAGISAPGRPHIAQALVEKGYFKTIKEAFAKYLHNDGPAYAKGENFPPQDAVRMINEAGGIAVLAHPWCCKNPIQLVPKLAAEGLHGIEVYHDSNKIDFYSKLAKESNLVMLGGSDYHGIDDTEGREPGDIPFPNTRVKTFLEFVKPFWKRSLETKLETLAQSKTSEKICIWAEQYDEVLETAKSLGLSITSYGTNTTYYRHIEIS